MQDFLRDWMMHYVYIPMAALAGAITALASSKVNEMTRTEMFLTVIAAFSFAIFVTPWIAVSWFKIDPNNVRAIAGLTYVFGSGANVLLPTLIRNMKKMVGYNSERNMK